MLILRSWMQPHTKYRSFMNPHRGQGRILAILKLQPEIGQRELGYLLDMSKQALAELLGKLEKSGYITRTQSEKDRRSYIIKLTDAGRDALPDDSFITDDNREKTAFFDCLNDEEQNNLNGYLGRIITELEKKFDDNDEDDYAEFIRKRFFAKHDYGCWSAWISLWARQSRKLYGDWHSYF